MASEVPDAALFRVSGVRVSILARQRETRTGGTPSSGLGFGGVGWRKDQNQALNSNLSNANFACCRTVSSHLLLVD